jgi:hypothetical protein
LVWLAETAVIFGSKIHWNFDRGERVFLCNFVRALVFNVKQTMKNEPFNHETPEPADVKLDVRLDQALARLPDAAVPSNFTARVMQAVELEESRRADRWSLSWNWHAWLPRIAVTAAVVFFAGLGLRQHEITAQRTALARNLVMVAGSQTLPSVDALKNFDAIQRMSQPRADEELLALLQ